MGWLTYIAKRNLEKTGYLKTGTDLSAVASDDSLNAASTVLTGLSTDQWVQTSGLSRGANSAFFQVKADSTSGKVLTLTPPVSHLRLPGVSGNYASTPDTGTNSVTGDFELIARAALVDWTPAAIQTLIAKWNTTGNQRSYSFSVNTDGTLNLSWSNDGTAVLSKNSTVATGFVDGTIQWVRATLDVNNGAAGNDVKFYTSADGAAWTQLGTTVTTGGTTSVFNSTAVLEVGSQITGTSQLAVGRVYYASLINGLGGAVANAFDAALGARGASSLVAATSETWTINTSGTPPAMLEGPRLVDEGAEYLSLPAIAGNYASTPDTAANSLSDDIDIRVKAAATDWSPSSQNILVGKYGASGNFAYAFSIDSASSGKLAFQFSTDGTAQTTTVSTVATGIPDGSTKWVRVTRAKAAGEVKYYTSDDYDPLTGAGTWTQLGTTVTGLSTGSIFNSTSFVGIGDWELDDTRLLSGKVYYAEIRNGINGPVVNVFDPGRAAAGATSVIAYTGETWTVNTSGSPAAALVRTTPITLTGYKRGLGQSYTLEFKLEVVDRSEDFNRYEQMPLGGGQAEVLYNSSEVLIDVQTDIRQDSEIGQWREYFASVGGGEVHTFDRYGTVSSPVEPKSVQLASNKYKEERVGSTMQYRLSFQLRLLN